VPSAETGNVERKGGRLTRAAALEYARVEGVLLASARGDVPRFIDAILGEPVRGNWWTHPAGNAIYNVLADVCASEDVLVCRLLGGKVTLIHRRLWPALVRVADRFDPSQLSQVHDEHTSSGRHVRREIAFPQWVPAEVHDAAARLTDQEAFAALGPAVAAATRDASRKRRQPS